MSTAHQEQLAHCHRFSFTNLVLRGSYKHTNFESSGGLTETTNVDDVRTVLVHEDRGGDCFSIHHEALHSTPFTEIGTISLETQAKLLRVIQEKEFMRVGSVETQKADVRIIAATNVDLKQMVAEARFRDASWDEALDCAAERFARRALRARERGRRGRAFIHQRECSGPVLLGRQMWHRANEASS